MTAPYSYFPCEFTPLLATLAGMGAVEQHVYLIILLRIYESGGVCRDSARALGMRTRRKPAAVQRAIDYLVGSGRLVDDGTGGFSNPKCDKVIARITAYGLQRTHIGFLGGKKTQENQRNRQAGASHLKRKEEERKKDAVNGADAHSVLAQVPDAETELYRRGKQVLGASSGGLITRLLKAKDGKINLARAAIETAAGKESPREYIGAVIRGAVVRPGDVVTYVDGRL
jgi:hypothetical protein